MDFEHWCELGDQLSDAQHSSSGDASPIEVAPRSYEGPKPPGTRRQQRKASRRALAASGAAASREEIDDYFDFQYSRPSQSLPRTTGHWPAHSSSFRSSAEQEEFELALAVSLSLSDSGSEGSARAIQRTLQGDLSFENLVNLEDVSRTLEPATIDSLGIATRMETPCDEVCPICLGEFVEGDMALELPCSHTFHMACASEWLLQYSKCCPVCKQEVCEGTANGEK